MRHGIAQFARHADGYSRRSRHRFGANVRAGPGLQNLIANSYGYVIFPEVGEAAVGIGGASGKGVVYQGGQPIGNVTMDQASIGVQLGGQTYAELIIFQDEQRLSRLMNNSIEFGADATATLVKAGAAGSTNFSHGVQVYILPKGGLMAGVSVIGQKFHVWPIRPINSSKSVKVI